MIVYERPLMHEPELYRYRIFQLVHTWDKFIDALENYAKIIITVEYVTCNVLMSYYLNFMTKQTFLIEHTYNILLTICTHKLIIKKGKAKVFLLQARCGPEGG